MNKLLRNLLDVCEALSKAARKAWERVSAGEKTGQENGVFDADDATGVRQQQDVAVNFAVIPPPLNAGELARRKKTGGR